jgi:hypothetical protein
MLETWRTSRKQARGIMGKLRVGSVRGIYLWRGYRTWCGETQGGVIVKAPARNPPSLKVTSPIEKHVGNKRLCPKRELARKPAHWHFTHSLALPMRGKGPNHRTPMSLSSFSRAISRTVVSKWSKAATSETSVILSSSEREGFESVSC